METACFCGFFFFLPDGSADCVSGRGVCGYEASEKNNNKKAYISRLCMNMSIPTCSVQTGLDAVMMLSRITIILTVQSAHR